jgi:hypothetical protein
MFSSFFSQWVSSTKSAGTPSVEVPDEKMNFQIPPLSPEEWEHLSDDADITMTSIAARDLEAYEAHELEEEKKRMDHGEIREQAVKSWSALSSRLRSEAASTSPLVFSASSAVRVHSEQEDSDLALALHLAEVAEAGSVAVAGGASGAPAAPRVRSAVLQLAEEADDMPALCSHNHRNGLVTRHERRVDHISLDRRNREHREDVFVSSLTHMLRTAPSDSADHKRAMRSVAKIARELENHGDTKKWRAVRNWSSQQHTGKV